MLTYRPLGPPNPPTSTIAAGSAPTWSPDGSRIAFSCAGIGGAYDICTVSPDGTALVRVTSEQSPGFIDAAWKPDGSQIAFATSRYGAFEIVLMNSGGGGVARINGGTPGLDPAWSRDGAKIAFSREDGGCDPDNGCYDSYDLYVMNADGSAVALLSTGGDDHEPDWRP